MPHNFFFLRIENESGVKSRVRVRVRVRVKRKSEINQKKKESFGHFVMTTTWLVFLPLLFMLFRKGIQE